MSAIGPFRHSQLVRDLVRREKQTLIRTAPNGSVAIDPKQKFAEPLLDNLVGDGEQRRWHVEAERLGGLEVDH
jgi:hypothetical protein